MARKGGFGTSLNPFASNSGSSLGQYSIGDSIRDLEAYRAEIAWGNGTLTDEEYRATLAKLVGTATAGTTSALSAQNKLDDVTYRIGRSQADAKGPDALIAFDQRALAGMNSGNLRYRDVKSSLDSELAQRRSRDYGIIVDNYNLGKTSTESLMSWVQKTVATLPADAPDKDNWASVQSSLTDRLVTEKDAKIYQDYQDRKMAPADFVAYLTGRRDAYAFSSPKYAEADRRLQDAQKNVKDAAQSVVDQDFANKYNNGKISDVQYLQYLGKRLDGMAAEDPQRPEWQQKLTQAAHSLAEDKLRYDVNIATANSTARSNAAHKDLGPTAAETTARKNLLSFYQSYATTLNPGSAEWRAANEQIVSLKGTLINYGSGGSGGSGGGTKKAAAAAGKVVVGGPGVPKIINPTGSFDAALALMTPNASAPSKDRTISVDNLRLNLQSANLAANDKVWLYSDPRYPGQTVTRQNPDGTIWKDAKGKTMRVPGSSYRATSSDEQAAMEMATATYQYALAGYALNGRVNPKNGKVEGAGNYAGYWTAIWHANTALEAVRNTQAHAIQRDITNQLDAINHGIDYATSVGDSASVVNLLRMAGNSIDQALTDTSLDQLQHDALQLKQDKLWANPLFPTGQTDMNGEAVPGGLQTGGFVDVANSPHDAQGYLVPGAAAMVQNVHYMLDTDSTTGDAKWGWKLDTGAPGTWDRDPTTGALKHVTVKSGRFGQIVTGEVSVSKAPTSGIWVTTQDGTKHLVPANVPADYFSYTDGDGNKVTGYSVDGGGTWVQATGGQLPSLEISGKVNWTTDADGNTVITDAKGVSMFAANGSIDPAFIKANPIAWYGQAAAVAGGDTSGGVGGPNSNFRIVSMDANIDGTSSLNFIPTAILYASQLGTRTLENPSGIQKTFTRTLENPSGAQPNAPVSPFTRTLENPSGATPGAAYARTLENPSGATPSTYFDQGAVASNAASWSAKLPGGGIISLGTGLPPAALPPSKLPVYYHPPLVQPAQNTPNVNAATGFVMPSYASLAAPVLPTAPAYQPPLVQPAQSPLAPAYHPPLVQPAQSPTSSTAAAAMLPMKNTAGQTVQVPHALANLLGSAAANQVPAPAPKPVAAPKPVYKPRAL